MSVGRARALRKKSTWAEKRLWRLLRDRRLAGYKFRRQRFDHPYYLDLYCHEAKLAVELDGSGHGFPEQQKHDQVRDAFFAARGILVKRIWNHQLARAEDRENLISNLWQLLQERAPHRGNIAPPPYRRVPDKNKPVQPSPWPSPIRWERECRRRF
jgi:very-short-patch-repair endonuclease